jgi:hypothetical protein
MNISISTKTSRDKSKTGITWNGAGAGGSVNPLVYILLPSQRSDSKES